MHTRKLWLCYSEEADSVKPSPWSRRHLGSRGARAALLWLALAIPAPLVLAEDVAGTSAGDSAAGKTPSTWPGQPASDETEPITDAQRSQLIRRFVADLHARLAAVVQAKGAQAYPVDARRDEIQGEAVVRVQYAAGGEVENMGVVQSTCSPALDAAALALVGQATVAAPEQVRAGPFAVRLPVVFRLEGLEPGNAVQLAGVVFDFTPQCAIAVTSVAPSDTATTSLLPGDELLRCERDGQAVQIPRHVLRCGEPGSDPRRVVYRLVVRRGEQERIESLETAGTTPAPN
jgi:TonB family protein